MTKRPFLTNVEKSVGGRGGGRGGFIVSGRGRGRGGGGRGGFIVSGRGRGRGGRGCGGFITGGRGRGGGFIVDEDKNPPGAIEFNFAAATVGAATTEDIQPEQPPHPRTDRLVPGAKDVRLIQATGTKRSYGGGGGL